MAPSYPVDFSTASAAGTVSAVVACVVVLIGFIAWGAYIVTDASRTHREFFSRDVDPPKEARVKVKPEVDGSHEQLPTGDLSRGARRLREAYTQAFDVALMLDDRTYPLADRAVAVVMTLGVESARQLAELSRLEEDLVAFALSLRAYARTAHGAGERLELVLSRLEPALGLAVRSGGHPNGGC